MNWRIEGLSDKVWVATRWAKRMGMLHDPPFESKKGMRGGGGVELGC